MIVIEPNCEQSPVFHSDWDQAVLTVHRRLCFRHRFQTSWPKWVFDSQFWPFGPYSVYSILRRSFIRRGRINEPVLTENKYTAATSFHGTADPDTKHVPLLSCSETASVATAPHTIPPPSTYHLLVRGPFPAPIINFTCRVGGVSQSRRTRSPLRCTHSCMGLYL